MTLDQYHTQWEQEAPLHLDALDEDARDVPLLHARWWRFYTAEKRLFKKLELEYKLLFRQKREWYSGKLDDVERLKLKWEPQPLKIELRHLTTYLDADADLQRNTAQRFIAEETLRFLESVIGCINKRGFDIKNAIDFLKFKSGK